MLPSLWWHLYIHMSSLFHLCYYYFVTVITSLEMRGMLPGRETLEILNMIESVMYESIRPDWLLTNLPELIVVSVVFLEMWKSHSWNLPTVVHVNSSWPPLHTRDVPEGDSTTDELSWWVSQQFYYLAVASTIIYTLHGKLISPTN